MRTSQTGASRTSGVRVGHPSAKLGSSTTTLAPKSTVRGSTPPGGRGVTKPSPPVMDRPATTTGVTPRKATPAIATTASARAATARTTDVKRPTKTTPRLMSATPSTARTERSARAGGTISTAGKSINAGLSSATSPGYDVTDPGSVGNSMVINRSFSFLGGAVSPSSPLYGEQLEPTSYQSMFSFSGKYSAICCVLSSASIWAANTLNGCIDIFSCGSGKLTSSLPPRILLPNAAASTPSRISAELSQKDTENLPKPTALQATQTHVWVGYDNGNVVIYDSLVHTAVSEGCFHRTAVISFGFFPDGTTVSGSLDGVLVHWDCESNNFEAITRIKTRDAGAEVLSCLASAEACWVVICGFESGSIYVTDISNGKHSASQRNHSKKITSLVIVRDLLFSAGEDKLVNVWRYDATPLPTNTYSIAGCGGTHIHSLKLLRRIPVNPAVCSLVLDRSTDSLWVTYVDGLMERWSANQDDDFGVEEIVREGMLHHQGGQRVVGMYPIHTVETLQVLALSSNGINNVWYGHYNTLEEKMNKAIVTLNNVIAQDSVDTAAWRGRMDVLRRREKDRKSRYVYVLEELSHQRLLLRFYEKWRKLVVRHSAVNPKAHSLDRNEKVEFLERKSKYKLARRFFTFWSDFYDRAEKDRLRWRAAAALESATKRQLMAYMLERWMMGIIRKRVLSSSRHCVLAVERANRGILLARYFFQWSQKAVSKKRSIRSSMTFTEDQLRMIESKSQIQILQRALRKWQNTTHALPVSTNANAMNLSSGSSLLRFAEFYAKTRQEQVQRGYFSLWKRWVENRKRYASLRVVAELFLKQQQQLVLQKCFACWQHFRHLRRIEHINNELALIGDQIHETESTNKDIFEKLQLQKRMEQLAKQKEADLRELEEDEARLQQLMEDAIIARDHLLHDNEKSPASRGMSASTAAPMARHTNWYREVLLQQRLLPSVLTQMPREEAIHHVMSQLKGNVINLYTDMSLFREVKDRRRSGQDAAEIFTDAFAELKRLVVPSMKGNGLQKNPTTLRWQLYMETLDSIPLHFCAPLLRAIKVMAIAFDLLPPDGSKAMSSTSDEVVANADWIFLIYRASYLRRRPSMPIH